jgi:uncharacterized integral membrane protein (TIGR00697 family)
MHEYAKHNKTIATGKLCLLQTAYTAVILLANWYDIRTISIAGLDTDAGTIIFPFSFLLSAIITEVYGYKNARKSIWMGFLFNTLFIIYGQLIQIFPSPSYAIEVNKNFDSLMSFNIRIIIASTISYFCAEPLGSFLIAKLKIKTQGKFVALRFIFCVAMASGIDSTIFTLIGFYKLIKGNDMLVFIRNMWIIKVAVEVLFVGIAARLASGLKTSEKINIYDTNTNFNLFTLDSYYDNI